MSVTVKKLYQNGSFLYHMEQIGGKSGMMNLVKWVHIIEDEDVSKFLHGNELVFTAGILNHTEDWLLEFAKKLFAAGASAFVVNIGPYTERVPKEVVAFCNQVGLPLFTIPWETRMVDMTRDFCQRIINSEQTEGTIASSIKSIIFKTGDADTHLLQLERYGYQRESRFCFISLELSEGQDAEGTMNRQDFIYQAEQEARKLHELFLSFSYKEYLIFVLTDYMAEEIELFLENFLARMKKKNQKGVFAIGIGQNKTGIYDLDKNFKSAIAAMEMAGKRKEVCCYYDTLNLHKLLYAIEDKSVIRQHYRDTILRLEQYDRENETQLTALLKSYLFHNGSLLEVAQIHYLHRNTVTNQLKKVEKILGLNPFELEDKVALIMAFYMKEML